MKIRKLLLSSLILGSMSLAAKDYLPQNLFLHVKTTKLGEALSDVNSFAAEAVKGSPMQAKVQPGMLKMLLPMSLGLPGGAINMEKPVHLLVGLPEDKVNGDPTFGIIFPLDDAEASLGKSMGVKKNKNGTFTLGNGLTVAPSLPGYVAFSDNQVNTLKYANLFKNNKFPKNNRGQTVSAIYDINKLMREVGSDAKTELMEELNEGLSQVSEQFPLPGLDLCLKNVAEEVFSLAEQTKAMQVSVDLSPQGIKYHVLVAPQAKTELSEITSIISTYKADFSMLQKQVTPAQISVSLQYNKALNDKLSTMFKRITKPLDSNETKVIIDTMNSTLEAYGSVDGEVATTLNYETLTQLHGASIFTVKDSKKFYSDYVGLIKDATGQTNEAFKALDLPLTSTVTEDLKNKKIDGATVSSYSFKYKLKKNQTLPEGVEMPDDLTYTVAALDEKHVILCWGIDSEKQIKTLLANYKNNSHNNTRASQLLKESTHNGLFAMAVDPFAIIKAIGASDSKNIPADLIAVSSRMPTLKTPIIVTGGTAKKLLSFKAVIPTEVIKTLITLP